MENAITIQEQINRIEGEIVGLLSYLKNTDWHDHKSDAVGQPLASVYPDEAAKRAAARERINELQAQLPALYAERQAEIEKEMAEVSYSAE